VEVALVAHGLPLPSSNGGPMTCFAILRQLLDVGHAVRVVALSYPGDPFTGPEREEELRREGVDLAVVPVEDSARLDPPPQLVRRVQAALEGDVAFVYHWDTIAATAGVAMPRLGVVDDLWHHPNLLRWRHTRPRRTRAYAAWTLETLRGLRPTAKRLVTLLNGCQASGSFQAETAAWLRRRGAGGCEYLPAPLADGGGPDWERRRGGSGKPRILLGPSNLEATSTSAGLRLFATEVLPALERELGPEGFVVRVVGEGSPPPELARLLPRPTVELTGRIEPADAEFLAAEVQLVPTPFPLGKRVRIIVGWSYGCCVVATESEAVNLPELRDGANALLGASGAEVATALIRALRDEPLRRRIALGGRATYEQRFAPHAAARPIIERLEALARSREAVAP